MSVSLLAYPTAGGKESTGEITSSLLQATDVGAWILSSFANIAEVKQGLIDQPIFLTRLAMAAISRSRSTSSCTTRPESQS